jgi:hypothetical protein
MFVPEAIPVTATRQASDREAEAFGVPPRPRPPEPAQPTTEAAVTLLTRVGPISTAAAGHVNRIPRGSRPARRGAGAGEPGAPATARPAAHRRTVYQIPRVAAGIDDQAATAFFRSIRLFRNPCGQVVGGSPQGWGGINTN